MDEQTAMTATVAAPEYRPPAFRLGDVIRVNHYFFGVQGPDEPPSSRVSDHVIDGIRLLPSYGTAEYPTEDRMIAVTSYPKGWEYHLMGMRADVGPWGWVSESKLIEKGYGSP